MHSFGTDFMVINDVRQTLDPKIFAGGPWTHLATVKWGFREFVCFKPVFGQKAYIEEIDIHTQGVFKRIEDDQLWADLYMFLVDRGYLLLDNFKAKNASTT